MSNVGFVTSSLPAGNYTSTMVSGAGFYPTPSGGLISYFWNLTPQISGIPTGYLMGDTAAGRNVSIHFNQKVDLLKNISIQLEGFDIWGNSVGFCPAYYEEQPHVNEAGSFGVSKIRLTCPLTGWSFVPSLIGVKITH